MNHIQKLRCCQVDAGKFLYGISPDHNAIFRIDEKKHEAQIEWIFPNVPLYVSGLYCAIARVNELLVCIPWRTDNILIYNFEKKESAILKLKSLFGECQYPYEFFYYHVCDGNIFILGTTIPMIIYLNVKEKRVQYLTNLYKKIESIKGTKCRYFFVGGCVQIKEWLFVPLKGYGAVVMVNINTRSTELRFPECDMEGYEGISKIGTEVCLLGRKGRCNYLVFWNLESNKTHIKKIPYEGETDLWAAFRPPVYYDSNIYLLPMSADHFYVMNMEEQIIRVDDNFDRFLEGCPKDQTQVKVIQAKLSENILTFITAFDNKWHKINLDNGESEDFVVEIADKNYWRLYERDVCCRELGITGLVPEGDLSLNNFIDVIISRGGYE